MRAMNWMLVAMLAAAMLLAGCGDNEDREPKDGDKDKDVETQKRDEGETPAAPDADEATPPADDGDEGPAEPEAPDDADAPAEPGAGARTPQDALAKMIAALRAGDKAQFLAVVHTEDPELAGAFFDFGTAAMAFQKRMEQAYGQGAYEPSKFPVPTAADLEKLDIQIEGDRAVSANGQMKFLKVNDGWKADMTDAFGPGAQGGQDAAMAKKVLTALQAAMQEQMPNIGKEGYTAEKINQELSTAMMKAMGADPKRMEDMRRALEGAMEGQGGG